MWSGRRQKKIQWNFNELFYFSPLQMFCMNPHYILFLHLVVNDMINVTMTTCLLLLTYIFYKINIFFCYVMIIFSIFSTLNTPFNLAVMAVECYIAVCLPLRHAQLCTIKRTHILIGSIWAMSSLSTLPDVFFIMATEPVQLLDSTIVCVWDSMFRHPVHLKKRAALYCTYLVVVWLILFYIYLKIFLAAKETKTTKSTNGDTKKARNTILLRGFQLMLCMLTYVRQEINKVLYYWFPKNVFNVLYVSYILTQTLPRLISPLVYGLRDKKLRQCLKKELMWMTRLRCEDVRRKQLKTLFLQFIWCFLSNSFPKLSHKWEAGSH